MEISLEQIKRDGAMAALLVERCAMIEAMHAEILTLRKQVQDLETKLEEKE